MASDKSQEQLESEHFSPYRADGKLYGFVCVVTNATHPIGQAIVHELAAHGAACIYALSPTVPLSPSDTHSTSTISSESATKIIPYPLPTLTEETSLALIDDVLNTWGRLDIWISSPSPSPPSSSSNPNPVESFEASALPAFYALKYAPAAMQKTMTIKGNYPNAAPKDVKYGSIIIVTSTSTSSSGVAETMASSAVLGLVKAGVGELGGTGVRINAVVMGEGRERKGRPDEVARAVGFLASGFSSYVTGSEVRVDGGGGA